MSDCSQETDWYMEITAVTPDIMKNIKVRAVCVSFIWDNEESVHKKESKLKNLLRNKLNTKL